MRTFGICLLSAFVGASTATLVTVAILMPGGVMRATDESSDSEFLDIVRARKIEVVDEDGETRIILEATKASHTSVQGNPDDGTSDFSIPSLTAQLRFVSPEFQRPLATLIANADNEVSFNLYDHYNYLPTDFLEDLEGFDLDGFLDLRPFVAPRRNLSMSTVSIVLRGVRGDENGNLLLLPPIIRLHAGDFDIDPSITTFDSDMNLRLSLGKTALTNADTGATERTAISSFYMFDRKGKTVFSAP